MSCDDCELAQNQAGVTSAYYYRWKNANIVIIGCHEHVKEIMDYLNERFKI